MVICRVPCQLLEIGSFFSQGVPSICSYLSFDINRMKKDWLLSAANFFKQAAYNSVAEAADITDSRH